MLALVITKLCTRRYMYIFSECAFCQVLYHFPIAHALYCTAKVTYNSKFSRTNFTWRKIESWSTWTVPIPKHNYSMYLCEDQSIACDIPVVCWTHFGDWAERWILWNHQILDSAWEGMEQGYVFIWSQYYYSFLSYTNVSESMGKSCSCIQFTKAIFLEVTRESISVLQVMWKFISGTVSHVLFEDGIVM